jgi:hypothetical protein
VSTAATAWIATSWPTDGKVLGRYVRARDHGQDLNTPDGLAGGRAEWEQARPNKWFLSETIRND